MQRRWKMARPRAVPLSFQINGLDLLTAQNPTIVIKTQILPFANPLVCPFSAVRRLGLQTPYAIACEPKGEPLTADIRRASSVAPFPDTSTIAPQAINLDEMEFKL